MLKYKLLLALCVSLACIVYFPNPSSCAPQIVYDGASALSNNAVLQSENSDEVEAEASKESSDNTGSQGAYILKDSQNYAGAVAASTSQAVIQIPTIRRRGHRHRHYNRYNNGQNIIVPVVVPAMNDRPVNVINMVPKSHGGRGYYWVNGHHHHHHHHYENNGCGDNEVEPVIIGSQTYPPPPHTTESTSYSFSEGTITPVYQGTREPKHPTANGVITGNVHQHVINGVITTETGGGGGMNV